MTEPLPEPVVKPQWIRLLDVFLIGPLMMAGGLALRKQKPAVGWPLAIFGLTTIGYNAINYYKVKALLESEVPE